MGIPVTYQLGTAGPARRHEFAGRDGRGPCARRRPRPRRPVAGEPEAAGGARRADRARRRRRRGLPRGRELQRQPRLDPRRPGDAVGRSRPARAGAASRCSATCWNSGRAARTITAPWRRRVESNGIDLVFTAGPLMRHLFEALPMSRRGVAGGDLRRTRRSVARLPAPGRRRDGEGLEQHPHGPDCRSAQSPLREPATARVVADDGLSTRRRGGRPRRSPALTST